MNNLFTTWWDVKTEQEKADLESALAVALNKLALVPVFILILQDINLPL